MKRFVIPAIISSVLILFSSCTGDNNASVQKEVISLDGTVSGRPYSPAIKMGNMLFVSGQIALNPETGTLVEGGIKEQTRQSLENIQALVEKAGFSLDNVVKCNVLMDTISFYGPMNEVYKEYFTENPPARKAYSVESLPLGALVEIDAIVIK